MKEVVKLSPKQQSLFWTKCPSCLDEIGYIKRKCNLRCPRCERLFSTEEEHQDSDQMQIKRLKEELAKFQQNNEASEKKYEDLKAGFMKNQ